MNCTHLQAKVEEHLRRLCYQIPNRRLGSEGNRQATTYVGDALMNLGFDVEFQSFDCLDWKDEGASLVARGETYEVYSSPYSLGCDLTARLVVARTMKELSKLTPGGAILLLKSEITQEQLMPRQFPFYNPEHHQKIYQLLEEKAPLGIITATSRNPELAGGMYPFPMIEDGDFDIPSVYMKDVDGEKLLAAVGGEVDLKIRATRIQARGHNVVARIGPSGQEKIVVCAHIDAKDNTPGALDNGTGVVMLLLLAGLLVGYKGRYRVELVALNGEDHYSAQGQKEYLKNHLTSMDQILLVINSDLAGYRQGHTAYSLYACPERITSVARETFATYEGIMEGEPWYQGDHSIFVQKGRPAIAITSDRFMELSTQITHTPNDDLNLVDPTSVVELTLALRDVIEQLNHLR
jgi:aminopeptidase YwaD